MGTLEEAAGVGIFLLGHDGLVDRVGQHVGYSVLALLIAAAIAVPAGLLIGHTGRGATVVTLIANVCRAVPSLGLMTTLILVMGLGLLPPIICLVLLAVPELLAGVYAGISSVDRATVDASRAIGMKEWQILFGVEVPNALPTIIDGLRNAALQVVATATIAAYVNLGGLGRYIFDGLSMYEYGQVIVGSVAVAVLSLIVDVALRGVAALVAPPARRRR